MGIPNHSYPLSAVPPEIAALTTNDVTGNTLMSDLVITPMFVILGLPEANISWVHSLNGATVSLSPDTDSRVEIEGGVLTVRGVQASDRGTYTVRASNGIGTDAEASVEVTIECEFNFTLLLLLLTLVFYSSCGSE